MPWQETLLMDQRVQFIADYQRAVFDIAELARRYGISRKTAYKWIERYEIGGPAELVDRSRRPAHCPHRTPPAIIAALLEVRRHHPTWGAKKLLKVVATRQPTWTLPARSTVCDLLDRAGLIKAPRHERMHRTLKAEVTRPPSGNLQAQQVRFNRFRHEYNDDRPHGSLGSRDARFRLPALAPGAPTNARAPGNTPDTSKSDSSVAIAVSAGRSTGSASRTPWQASTSDWKKSTMGSGTYTSGQ